MLIRRIRMKNNSSFTHPLLLILAIIILPACSSVITEEEKLVAESPTNTDVSQRTVQAKEKEVHPGHVNFRPLRYQKNEVLTIPSGSLFNANKAIGIYQARNIYEIGDMILVKLDESMLAQKQLNYKSQKSDSFTLEPVTLNAGSINVSGDKLNAEYDQEKDFDSSAQSKQSNSLVGDITVFVREITPNGNLIVAGEKWMSLNKGQEYIRFSGEVRARDIEENNTVSSIKIGNTQIVFTGKGELQENQDESFLGTLFSVLD